MRWPEFCGRLATLASFHNAVVQAALVAGQQESGPRFHDAGAGGGRLAAEEEDDAPLTRPLLLAGSSWPTAAPDFLHAARIASVVGDAPVRHGVIGQQAQQGEQQREGGEGARDAKAPLPTPTSLTEVFDLRKNKKRKPAEDEEEEQDKWSREREEVHTTTTEPGGHGLLDERQATTASGHFTTIAVLGATATATLLPVIGLDGQIVTPVVVPVSTSTPTPGVPTSSAPPAAAPPPAATVTGTTTATEVVSVTSASIVLQTSVSIAVQTSVLILTSTAAAANNPPQSQASAPARTTTVGGGASETAPTTPMAETAGAGVNGTAGAEPVIRIDPANGPFLGGDPNSNVDLPVTIVFLILFLTGAFTHISIYRANAKRGHKFLLSDLVFDFCMVRSVTCTFRIIWIFVKLRGVILAALIFQFGGAAVLFVLGIFFIQRLIRAMHPSFGWTPFFRFFTIFLAFSVPANVLLNLTSITVSFFSVDNPDRLDVAEDLLKFGASWNLWLALYPSLALFIASWIPGPRIERFGMGPFRIKVAVLIWAGFALGVGAAVRLAQAFNPVQPGTEASSPLFNKATFYTTQFMLEILTVIIYAVARVDLRYHVPDGCTGPGDYSAPLLLGQRPDEMPLLTKEQITGVIEDLGIPYEILQTGPRTASLAASSGQGGEPVVAVFYAQTRQGMLEKEKYKEKMQMQARASGARELTDGPGTAAGVPLGVDGLPLSYGYAIRESSSSFGDFGRLPPRVERVSRRRSIIEAVSRSGSQRSPPRRAPRKPVNGGAGNAIGSSSNSSPLKEAGPARRESATEKNLTSWIRETAYQQQMMDQENGARVPPPEKGDYTEYLSFSDGLGRM